jgi:hypothetical protein
LGSNKPGNTANRDPRAVVLEKAKEEQAERQRAALARPTAEGRKTVERTTRTGLVISRVVGSTSRITKSRTKAVPVPAVGLSGIRDKITTDKARLAQLRALPDAKYPIGINWSKCDVCNQNIHGVYYHCKSCASFDCCEKCCKKGAAHFESTHPFEARHMQDTINIRLKANDPAEQAEAIRKAQDNFHRPGTVGTQTAAANKQRRAIKAKKPAEGEDVEMVNSGQPKKRREITGGKAKAKTPRKRTTAGEVEMSGVQDHTDHISTHGTTSPSTIGSRAIRFAEQEAEAEEDAAFKEKLDNMLGL